MLSKKDVEVVSKFVLNPESSHMFLWESIVNIIYLLSFFFIPFILCDPHTILPTVHWLEFFFDIVIFLDIILDFFTMYKDDTEWVKDHKKIAINYLSSYFIFDCISVCPGLFTAEYYPNLYYCKIVRYIQIPRFFEHLSLLLSKVSC